jgi:uncharacterized protein (DUF1501 family)
MADTLKTLYAGAPALLSQPAGQVMSSLAAAKTLAAKAYQPANGAVYPDDTLGRALRDVARLIKGQAGLMTACVDSGDWDIHENLGAAEPGKRMHDKLAQLAAALAAFATDLGSTGMKRVTLVTVSEFGRRVRQNGSKGLDHRWPGLGERHLVDGDLAVTTDYRAVIGEILHKRCGLANTRSVFPTLSTTTSGVVRTR